GCDYQISKGWDWFPHVSGMTYSVINSQLMPKGQRIGSLKVKNSDGSFSDLDLAATYKVVTNNFLAGGGDGFTTLKNGKATDTGLIDADVFADYLRSLGTVSNPTDQRVTVLTPVGSMSRHAVTLALLRQFTEEAFIPFRKAA
ncbi:MAG: 5'-nucleotidase C-terminal domain-containing protein, partial [Syntrophales bacterium LBB04]|nr:5'-nucleotidase C-terminal domain-containing protein [Syntrophales bacterium LBB04]